MVANSINDLAFGIHRDGENLEGRPNPVTCVQEKGYQVVSTWRQIFDFDYSVTRKCEVVARKALQSDPDEGMADAKEVKLICHCFGFIEGGIKSAALGLGRECGGAGKSSAGLPDATEFRGR